MSASAQWDQLTPVPQPIPPPLPARLFWVDNLRTAMIVLVVNMHACVTYSHIGSWYVMADPEPALGTKLPFLLWQGHLQAFFMGLLFFLAGTFAHQSLTRRGAGGFLAERLVRLGIPSVLYMVLIHPFIVYVLLGQPHRPNRPSLRVLYLDYLGSGRVLSGNGPLWFALALLIFCFGLVGWRTIQPSHPSITSKGSAPSAAALTAFGFALVAATFLVRTVQPVGTNLLNFQLCYFPQYVGAFCAGVTAGHMGWFNSLAESPRARTAGWLGLIGGPLLLLVILVSGGGASPAQMAAYRGGWNLQALGAAAWEQLAGLGLALGAIYLFRHIGDIGNRLTRWLSDRAFGVYVLHAPVLVALTLPLLPHRLNPFAGAGFLTVAGLVVSFAIADGAKRIPGLRTIL